MVEHAIGWASACIVPEHVGEDAICEGCLLRNLALGFRVVAEFLVVRYTYVVRCTYAHAYGFWEVAQGTL